MRAVVGRTRGGGRRLRFGRKTCCFGIELGEDSRWLGRVLLGELLGGVEEGEVGDPGREEGGGRVH